MKEQQICVNCVMNTTDPDIHFDKNGVCNYCNGLEQKTKDLWFPNEKGREILDGIFKSIKKDCKNKAYDCVIGLSGGVDSSYLALKLKEDYDLRVLVVHVDAGWNSELAVKNIQNIVDYCGWDLHTIVIDWEEIKALQLAFLKTGLKNQDIPQDHAFFESLYTFAIKNGVRNVISGGNFATESILPKGWGTEAMDARIIRDVYKNYTGKKLRKFKTVTYFKRYVYYNLILRMRVIRPLDLMPYDKKEALKELEEKIGYKQYERKHGESIWTKFFQNHWLPEVYCYDKRLAHLSSMIVSGLITREEALEELKKPLYNLKELEEDKKYVAKKLGITIEELNDTIYNSPKKSHSDFKNQEWFYKFLKSIYKLMIPSYFKKKLHIS